MPLPVDPPAGFFYMGEGRFAMKKRDGTGLIPEQLYTKDPLRDVITGIIVGLVSIPISMGYAQIAGLTPVYGLYGSLLPILVFGLISSSRRFVFGVDAAPAALTGGILAAAGVTAGSGQALKLVPAISLLTAVWLLLFFLADAGRIVRFISASVMGGFITGIGITIILMQVPKLFGGSAGRGELPELIRHIYTEASQNFHLLSFLMGLATILIIRVFARKCPAVPMAVIMMGAGMAAGALLGLEDLGVRMLPAVQAGLPVHRLPDLSVIFRYGNRVVFSSLTIALVITSETLLASTNLARKHDEKEGSPGLLPGKCPVSPLRLLPDQRQRVKVRTCGPVWCAFPDYVRDSLGCDGPDPSLFHRPDRVAARTGTDGYRHFSPSGNSGV